MKLLKKILYGLSIAAVLVPSFALAAPWDFQGSSRDKFDSTDTPFTITPYYDAGVYSIPAFLGLGYDSGTPYGSWTKLSPGSGVIASGGNLAVTINSIETPDGTLSDTLNLKATVSSVSTLNSLINTLIATPPLDVPAFMANNASTSPFIASSTKNGFLSLTDKVKLDTLALPTAATTSRSIVTGTGATGFQISATRPTNDCYSVTIVSGSTLIAPVYGYIALEIAPTNSATSSAWVELGRTGGGDTIGILHTGTATGQLCGFIPAGYYAKLRAVNVAGTATYSYNSGQEVIW